MHKAIIAIGIAVAVCLAVGCGSTGDETAEAAVTKAQFIKEAEAICQKTLEEGRDTRVAWEKANGKEMEFEATYRNIVGPTLEREADELRSLASPEKDAAALEQMIDNLSKGAAAFTAEGSRPKSSLKLGAFEKESKAYGLKGCGL